MPNVWAHLIFGQLVLEKMKESKLIAADDDKAIFNMGCQGPDFLFYHRFLPWQKSIAMNRMATAMHNEHCGPALIELLDSVNGRKACPGKADRAVLYALGFVLHHVLDRNMHPFVFSKSGFRMWDHQRYEIMMDTVIARKLWGIETWNTPVWRYINTNGRFPEQIVDAFETIAGRFYPELAMSISRKDWHDANRDFTNAQRLFHDPSGVRSALTFGAIEPFVFRKGPTPYDVMNEQDLPWIDPTDKEVYHRDNGWTLWDRAMDDATDVMSAVLIWLRAHEAPQPTKEDRIEVRQLREIAIEKIGNFSYETGLPCDIGVRIRYAETVWPDQPGITEAAI
jgi:hypothetical protein